MKSIIFAPLFLIIFLFSNTIKSQGLLDDLDSVEEKKTKDTRVYNTFGGLRIINQQSVETILGGSLNFLVQHRFGAVNNGFSQLFGLDGANVRLSLAYGITDEIMFELGRDGENAVVDGNLKYKIAQQSDKMPFTMTYIGSMGITTIEDTLFNKGHFTRRMYFSHQMLFAKKFSFSRKFLNTFSIQIAPGILHRNYVISNDYNNLAFSLGLALRAQITESFFLVGDYIQSFGSNETNLTPAIGIGGEFVTGGGHSFQLHFTNAAGMHENSFIRSTRTDFLSNEIRFGFNISRVFYIGKIKSFQKNLTFY